MTNVPYTFAVYSEEYIVPLLDFCRDEVSENVVGCRNQAEELPRVFQKNLVGGYWSYFKYGELVEKWYSRSIDTIPYIYDTLKQGDIVIRRNGKEFGCAKHSDYRQVLDVVTVGKVLSSKLVCIGTAGERVRLEQVICVCRKVGDFK